MGTRTRCPGRPHGVLGGLRLAPTGEGLSTCDEVLDDVPPEKAGPEAVELATVSP